MTAGFTKALLKYQHEFDIVLTEKNLASLTAFYKLIQANNPLLHLVAPCSEEEFAIRHILEPLLLQEFLPECTVFADVGTGAGLPSIPCLLTRNDLSALLIESKDRKADYLEKTIEQLGLAERANVYARQFTEVDISRCSIVTTRALDRFSERLPRLIKWAGKRRSFLFGGNKIRETLSEMDIKFTEKRIPLSDQRFIFCI